jgi:hypothetical protein
MWIGLWMHTHTFAATNHSPDLGELMAEILGQGCVKMMPLRYGWGCKTFQTAPHLHLTSILSIYIVFEHLLSMWIGIWMHTRTVTATKVSPDLDLDLVCPDLGELAEILGQEHV